MQTTKRLAVLIDAENSNAQDTARAMANIHRFGRQVIKRAYGDWSTTQLSPWTPVLFKLAIKPMQQLHYARGKNSSDCALIIDAMDLLHSGKFDAFCIVASDSDYIGLATRIREAGLAVYGFGTKQAPHAFRAACDEFVLIDEAVVNEAQKA